MKSPYRKTTLDNGIRVVTYNMPQKQSVALGVWIKAGGRYETKENKGIAHFLEHMCFKGSKKYSCRKLKESIEGVGGSLNGFTSEELTCYLAKLPWRHFALALDVLCDMSINPVLAAEEIEKERAVILEEIKMYRDLPQSYVHDLLDELLWPAHPLGMSIVGYAESVAKTGQEDLRFFKDRHYTPANITISACGKLNHSGLLKSLENIFSRLKTGKANVSTGVCEKQAQPQLKILPKDTEQTHLALGFHGFKRDHRLKYALGLLHVILGANMSSRLFEELREKRGLAYEIGTQVKCFQDTGAFVVHAGIDNLKAGQAIELILKELAKIKNELVSSDEYNRAKEFYLGQLSLALEDTLDHMLWIGDSTAALDKTYSLGEVIKEVSRIKRQDIRTVARGIFKEQSLNLALIGPLENKKREIGGVLHLD
ncbi:insulinase family protein [bacterium]|nr:MAG: insulinase family protein [bacterium]